MHDLTGPHHHWVWAEVIVPYLQKCKLRPKGTKWCSQRRKGEARAKVFPMWQQGLPHAAVSKAILFEEGF